MVIDDNGWPVIRRMLPEDEGQGEAEAGIASEDEARAQQWNRGKKETVETME